MTGLDAVEEGAKYHQTTQTPFGRSESDFIVDRLEDLREIKVRCLLSGYYLHWQLTEAGDDTFTQVEVGMDPTRIGYHAVDKTVGRRWYRKVVEETLARLRETIK